MWTVRAGIFWFIGLWLASEFTNLSWQIWLLGVGVGAILTVLGLGIRFDPLRTVGFLLAIGCLAGGRYILAQPTIDSAHVAFYNESEVILTGLVVDEPYLKDQNSRLDLRVEAITLAGGATREVTGRVFVTLPRFPVIQYGTRIRLIGELAEPPEFDTFDYRAYLQRQGVHSLMLFPQVEVLEERVGSPFFHAIYDFKSHAKTLINRFIAEPAAALLNGILLGDDSGLPEELDFYFRQSGMSHIIAISGYNVALLAGLLLGITRPAGQNLATGITTVVLIAYAILVGAEPSVVRATIMGIIYVVSKNQLGQRYNTMGVLMVAGMGMTLFNPFAAWDVGFQLSFTATLGILIYAQRFANWMKTKLAHYLTVDAVRLAMDVLAELVCVTLAAQLLTLPLIIFYFGQLSLISLIANLVILPVQPFVMILGGLTILVGLLPVIGSFLGQLMGWGAWLFLSYSIVATRLLGGLPFAALPFTLNMGGVIALYLLIGAVSWLVIQPPNQREQVLQMFGNSFFQRLALGILVIGTVLTFAWGRTQPDGQLHLYFFNVGHGNATLIVTPTGRQILVDGGASPTRLNSQLGAVVPFWDRQIDMVIATNPSANYVAGLSGVFERYQVEQFLNSGATLGASSAYDALSQQVEAGQVVSHTLQLGEAVQVEDGVAVQVAFADQETLVLRLDYGDLTVTLGGAIAAEMEQKMVARGDVLASLVYHVAQQGSDKANLSTFLQALSPQILLLSSGENRAGDPKQAVLERLALTGAPLLRTDQLGTIELVSDGSNMMWWGYGQ